MTPPPSAALLERPVALPAPATTAPTADLDQLAIELDEIRREVMASLGQADANYIRRIIRIQRGLDLAGRAALIAGIFPPAWVAGVAMLSLAKILENMEIGHNVIHGQWDWMRDDEIHSSTWEWDHACPASQWKHSHNYLHHQWTNVMGLDHDLGYGAIRINVERPWKPKFLAQPLMFVATALFFEYGIAFYDLETELTGDEPVTFSLLKPKLFETFSKLGRQLGKDFVLLPLLALPFGIPSAIAAAAGALAANLIRNLWTFGVIFCGHFPEGVEVFTRESVESETRGGWYRRQILGSANITGGRLVHVLTGNLDHQIEHHLFPDMPSNRYAEVAPKVRAVCERHGITYNTGSFRRQFGTVIRKVLRFTLP